MTLRHGSRASDRRGTGGSRPCRIERRWTDEVNDKLTVRTRGSFGVVIRTLGRALAAVVLVVFTPVACVMVVLAALIFLPLPATLPQPRPDVTPRVTHVLDADGNEIGVYRKFDTNIPV